MDGAHAEVLKMKASRVNVLKCFVVVTDADIYPLLKSAGIAFSTEHLAIELDGSRFPSDVSAKFIWAHGAHFLRTKKVRVT
jgi:hypothetical protein